MAERETFSFVFIYVCLYTREFSWFQDSFQEMCIYLSTDTYIIKLLLLLFCSDHPCFLLPIDKVNASRSGREFLMICTYTVRFCRDKFLVVNLFNLVVSSLPAVVLGCIYTTCTGIDALKNLTFERLSFYESLCSVFGAPISWRW